MMKKRDIHVVPHEDGWAYEVEKAKRVSRVFDTKVEAMKAGRERAKADQVEFVEHNRDGKISNPNSYGNDPNPPRDKRR